MEHWHFLSVQIWVLVIGNMVMALFQVLVYGLAVYTNDYADLVETHEFLLNFAFECMVGHPSRWWIAKSSQSEMMYELHPIILHMYVTLGMLVIATVPFKYDRLYKTRREKEAERKSKHKKKKEKDSKNQQSKIIQKE